MVASKKMREDTAMTRQVKREADKARRATTAPGGVRPHTGARRTKSVVVMPMYYAAPP